jgi:hypothetical protein
MSIGIVLQNLTNLRQISHRDNLSANFKVVPILLLAVAATVGKLKILQRIAATVCPSYDVISFG